MPEKQTQYELEKQYQEELRADWARQQKPEELEELDEHLAEEQLKDELRQQTTPELAHYDSLIDKDEQQIAAERLGQMKGAAKQQAKKIKAAIVKKATKKVASAVWKKVAARVALLIGPEILTVLGIIALVLLVVLLTLAVKCEITQRFAILKPILSWVGITCPVSANGTAAPTTAAPATQ